MDKSKGLRKLKFSSNQEQCKPALVIFKYATVFLSPSEEANHRP